MQTLERELPSLLRGGERLDGGLHLAVDQDLAVGGFAAQARREVDHGADGGIVEAPFEADAAERGVALGDADAEAELMAVLAPFARRASPTLPRISTAMRTARSGTDPGTAADR